MLRKILLLFFMISLSVAVNAYDIVIDGIYYILDSDNQTASVTYKEHKNGAYKSDYEGDVSIPESVVHQGVNYRVTAIGSHAFQGCKGLTSISVPTSVRMIGHFAFIRCSNLKSVMLSEGLDTIRSGAFAQCEALESIVIPNTVTAVHEHAFAGCVNLVSATMGEGVTSIMNSVFTGCSSLTDIVLLGEITEISGMAFYCCTSLNAFNIPESVEYVDYSAFEGCSGLLCITIPRNIRQIGHNAFRLCYNIKDVYCYSPTVPLSSADIFGAYPDKTCLDSATLYVPQDAIPQYISYSPWAYFFRVKPIEGQETGIELVHSDLGASSCFSLNGQRLPHPQKGINIINGKKVVVN